MNAADERELVPDSMTYECPRCWATFRVRSERFLEDAEEVSLHLQECEEPREEAEEPEQ